MATRPEHQLAARAIRGEGRALDALWRLHRRWVAAVVLAHKPAEAEVDDLLQEVACSMVRHVGDVRDPARLRPWLRTLARNTAVSAGRKATVRRRHLRALGPDDLIRPDPTAGPTEDQVAAEQAASRALEATGLLTPEQRECLLLRAVHGMTQRRIAETLEVPVTTVETRLARARRRLRAELADIAPERARAARGR